MSDGLFRDLTLLSLQNSTTAPLTIPSRRHSDDQMSALTSQESAELRGYERLSRSSQQYCNVSCDILSLGTL